MKTIEKYANPFFFLRLARRLQPFFLAALLVFGASGLYYSLYASPPDYLQKETVRIMYIHVPAAWGSMAIFASMAIMHGFSFVRGHMLAAILARNSAKIGFLFAFICLATGSLWGKPTWGTWWVWDARLTSMLILFFLYAGYLLIWNLVDDFHKAARLSGLFCLIGAIDLPIIHYSVYWWNSLHQGNSILRLDGPTIHHTMLWPLALMGLAYLFYYLSLLIWMTQTELWQQRAQRTINRHKAVSQFTIKSRGIDG